MDLKSRAQNFLDLPIPRGIEYASDSVAEMFIRNYAVSGDFDDELLELGQTALATVDEALDEGSTAEVEEYYMECKGVLTDILRELGVE